MIRKLTSIILIFVLTSLILFSGCFCVFAEEYDDDFSITLPDGFITAFSGDDKSEIAEVVGITAEEVESYFEKNNLKFLSVNNDNTSQIKLSVLEDDFSQKIISFNNLENDKILKLANSLFTGSYEQVEKGAKIVQKDGIKFLKYVENLADNGGEYTVTQYVTVHNGKTYRLSVFATSEQKGNFSDTVFETFILKQNTNTLPPLTKIFIIVGIVVFAIIIVLSVFR